MSLKKSIAMGMATGLVGMALISGGTVAYFSDSVETQGKIISGTLDLGVTNINEDGVLFEFANKKPGDKFDYTFQLTNDGSLDMKDISLASSHDVYDENGTKVNNGFGSQIKVTRIEVAGQNILSKKGMTLDELKKKPLVIYRNFTANAPAVDVYVAFEFIKTGKDQNQYQGNALDLAWTFQAMQMDE